jgi:hypothetical protein
MVGILFGPLSKLGDGNPFVGDDGNGVGFNISLIRIYDKVSDLNSRHSTIETERITEIVRKMLADILFVVGTGAAGCVDAYNDVCFLEEEKMGVGVNKIVPQPTWLTRPWSDLSA